MQYKSKSLDFLTTCNLRTKYLKEISFCFILFLSKKFGTENQLELFIMVFLMIFSPRNADLSFEVLD